MRHRPTIATVVAVSAVMLASCSSQTSGTATPESTGRTMPPGTTAPNSPGGGDQLPAHGAPNVPNPLDVSAFLEAPCDALTEAQAKELLGDGVATAPRPDDAEGPACGWSGEQLRSGQIKISFITATGTGLSGAYSERGKFYKYFVEIPPVGGYPAVALGVRDSRGEGDCGVQVGTSNRMSFGVTVTLSEKNVGKKDPCEVGQLIAKMVLENIKGAQ